MFIENAYKALHKPWMYLVGVLVSFFASQVGGIFLLFFVAKKIMVEGGELESITNPSVMMNTLNANATFFWMIFGFAIGLAILLLFVKKIHKQKLKDLTTTRRKIDWKRIGFGFMLIAIPSVIITLIDFYIQPEDYILQFEIKSFLVLLLIAVLFIPLQTSYEEYLFRGYLMQGIGINGKSRGLALIGTSVIFGMLHFFNPEMQMLGNGLMIYYIGTGLLLGIMTLMDEGMELALGYHAGNNLIIALLVTTDWGVFQTPSILKDISEPSMGAEVLVTVLVLYPVFLFILAKKYKWTGYKEKLFGNIEKPKLEIKNELESKDTPQF